MDMDSINDILQWNIEVGFICGLRYRQYNYGQGRALLNALKEVPAVQGDLLDVAFFRKVWDIGMFLEVRQADFRSEELLGEAELLRLRELCDNILVEIDRIINAGA